MPPTLAPFLTLGHHTAAPPARCPPCRRPPPLPSPSRPVAAYSACRAAWQMPLIPLTLLSRPHPHLRGRRSPSCRRPQRRWQGAHSFSDGGEGRTEGETDEVSTSTPPSSQDVLGRSEMREKKSNVLLFSMTQHADFLDHSRECSCRRNCRRKC